MTVIKYDKISIKLDNEYLFRDFSLTINKNEKVILYGHSGIGKTTLFKLLLGYSKPDKGKILYNENELDEHIIWEIRKNVSYVPQNLDIFDDRVCDFIDKVFSYKHNYHKSYSKDNLNKLLLILNLNEKILTKNFQKLSGGEKQRIAIIICILLERNIYLLDEITSSLDGKLKNIVIDIFTKEIEGIVLAISHDPEWLKSKNIRVINLEENRIGS